MKLLPCNNCGQLPEVEPGIYRNFGTFSQWYYACIHCCIDGVYLSQAETEEEMISKYNQAINEQPKVIKRGTQLSLF